jgi:hypothetical protein
MVNPGIADSCIISPCMGLIGDICLWANRATLWPTLSMSSCGLRPRGRRVGSALKLLFYSLHAPVGTGFRSCKYLPGAEPTASVALSPSLFILFWKQFLTGLWTLQGAYQATSPAQLNILLSLLEGCVKVSCIWERRRRGFVGGGFGFL